MIVSVKTVKDYLSELGNSDMVNLDNLIEGNILKIKILGVDPLHKAPVKRVDN